MWIDVNDCEERYHEIKLEDGKPVCIHADDSICEESEYSVEDEAA